ncbi:hypothetical protein BJ741DRAFT_664173 [Chytriomyces cf. hyalinus JEL632]|nr:hypothetical protein BJ741DRAFT_664173 [Chytriomyces cf. hyalinus JEL632]
MNASLGPVYLDVYANKVKAIKNDKNLAYQTGIEPFYMIAGVLIFAGSVYLVWKGRPRTGTGRFPQSIPCFIRLKKST